MKRHGALAAILALSACGAPVTVPQDATIYEVPPTGTASSYGGEPLYGAPLSGTSIDPYAADPYAADPLSPASAGAAPVPVDASGTPLDDDQLNLTLYTIEQQKVDAAIAERELAEARSQLVVVPPSGVPNQPQGVNIALYAQQSANTVGQRVYDRSLGSRVTSSCGRYRNPDDAQRAFLSAGGPQTDRLGLDSDGDGFACRWDPEPYRALR
jgi:hypothetical protein